MFAFVVLLGKEYGGGGDNNGAEGATVWKIFCGGDNGGAVGASRGLVLGSGGGGDGGAPCEGRGAGGSRKFKLILKKKKNHQVLSESRYQQDLVLFLLECLWYLFFQYRVLLARN